MSSSGSESEDPKRKRKMTDTVMKRDDAVSPKKSKMNGIANDEISGDVEHLFDSLSNEDLLSFLDQVSAAVPHQLQQCAWSRAYEKMDWTKVMFKGLNPVQCKSLIALILSKQRKYRTHGEIVVDAREWVQTKRALPKKPKTTYIRFFQKELKKMKEKDPKTNCIEASKIISARYKTLSPTKRAKLDESFRAENEDYKKQIIAIGVEKPVRKKIQKSTKKVNPMLPRSPFMIFMKDERKKSQEGSKTTLPKFLAMREKWNALDNYNKAVYIQLSKQEFIRMCVTDNLDIIGKSPVTKEEEKIYLQVMGYPIKPVLTGFSLFSQGLLKNTDLREIAARWKALSEKEQKVYNDVCKEKLAQYKREVAAYEQTLSDAEKSSFKLVKILPWRNPVTGKETNHVEELMSGAVADGASSEEKKAEETALNETGGANTDEFPTTPRSFFQRQTGQKKKVWKSIEEEERQKWIKKFEKKKRKHEKKMASLSQEIDFSSMAPPLYNSTPMFPPQHFPRQLLNKKKKELPPVA